MKKKHIYICENSTTGIFTGIYDAWASGNGHDNNEIVVEEPENLELFADFIRVKPDMEKAEKVKRSICEKISKEAYIRIYHASLSKDKTKANVIYRVLILGFSMGSRVMEHMSDQYVNHMLKLSLNVKREDQHYEGFLRFVNYKGQFLLARFRPDNDILLLVAEHFHTRMSGENWIIYDERRKKAAVQQADCEWLVLEQYELNSEQELDALDEQDEFLRMWKRFVTSIAIEERTNEKLQQNMLPSRYREFMPETNYKRTRRSF